MYVGHAEIFCHRGIFLADSVIHSVGNFAVRLVAGLGGAKLGDVNRFRKVHVEEAPLAVGEWQKILGAGFGFMRSAGGESDGGVRSALHVRAISRVQPGSSEFAGLVESVQM